MRQRVKKILIGFGFSAAFFLIFAGSLFGYWFFRPNSLQINPKLHLQDWDVVADGWHNANTDMIEWNGTFYLVYNREPTQLGSPLSKVVLMNSSDMLNWTEIHTINLPGEDIRDPKLAVIGTRLFVYFLKNAGLIADPYATSYQFTDDGITWSTTADVAGQDGWLFWRPKTYDGVNYYVPAYWREHNMSKLLTSKDGINWTDVSMINEGRGNDETDCAFYPDGRLLVTSRLEGVGNTAIGDPNAGTLIAVAPPPYTSWTYYTSTLTRLDGPNLFNVSGQVFAFGRYQPERDILFTQLGSSFSNKRTALFSVEPDKLTYISDMPSSGDTSYAGVIIHDGQIYAEYYTSDVSKDYGWLLGMLLPSNIHMVNISTTNLLLAAASPLFPVSQLPWGGYIVVALNGSFIVAVIWLVLKRGKARKHLDPSYPTQSNADLQKSTQI